MAFMDIFFAVCILSVCVIAILAATIKTLVYAMDCEYIKSAVAAIVAIIAVSCLIYFISSVLVETNHPCIKHETTMQYNPAIKMVMPVRYCTKYGEWVQEDDAIK